MTEQPGAPEAVAVFCAREHPRLVGALGLYTGDPLLAEELAQEALARACRDWRRVGAMDAPGAWVHRVAMNLAKSGFRRRAAAVRAHRRAAAGRSDRVVEETADAVAVRTAVAALGTRKRTVVVLRFFLGYTTAETAAFLGAPEATVRSLLHRAKQDLRAALEHAPAMEGSDG